MHNATPGLKPQAANHRMAEIFLGTKGECGSLYWKDLRFSNCEEPGAIYSSQNYPRGFQIGGSGSGNVSGSRCIRCHTKSLRIFFSCLGFSTEGIER